MSEQDAAKFAELLTLLEGKAAEWRTEYEATDSDADYGRWDAWENAAHMARAHAGKQTAPPALDVERLAEALSWTSGEFTHYDPDAHPDHNRWSWRGDGHDEVVREEFRVQARRVIEALGGGA